jgi:hypothetical protein
MEAVVIKGSQPQTALRDSYQLSQGGECLSHIYFHYKDQHPQAKYRQEAAHWAGSGRDRLSM